MEHTPRIAEETRKFFRLSRIHQMRGSTDEGTGAYTISYVRIPEDI